MSLADRLAAEKHPNAGCGFGAALELLDDDTAAEVLEALHDPRVSDRVLKEHVATLVDNPPGVSSYGQHRRGDCRCDG